MNFDTLPPLLEQIKSGKLRALAVSTPKILPKLPNVTKFIEVGVQGFDVTNWYSIMCPKGMSQDIVNKLDKVIKTAMTDQSIKATLDSQGLQVCGLTFKQYSSING